MLTLELKAVKKLSVTLYMSVLLNMYKITLNFVQKCCTATNFMHTYTVHHH